MSQQLCSARATPKVCAIEWLCCEEIVTENEESIGGEDKIEL